VDIPVVLWQDGVLPESPPTRELDLVSSGLSDIRIAPKVVLLDTVDSPVGLALVARMSFPTGQGGSFLGEESVTANPTAIIEFADGAIHEREHRFRLAFNFGYLVRDGLIFRDLVLNSAFTYRAGLSIHPTKLVEMGLETVGWVAGPRKAHAPMEFIPSIRLLPAKDMAVTAGVGLGMLPGLGSPDYRVFLGATLSPSFNAADLDRDRDGLSNKVDRCKNDPEDFDEFQDDDGCPDVDNDKDTILDVDDQCPNDPEDWDEFQDADGCPDVDNDKDGILDAQDQCPDVPETVNGYMDEDGCPDEEPASDSDKDGLDDDIDNCPYDPEDFDRWEDEDGCPDRDNDLDGILDADDQCPNEKEVFNSVEDEDGCPDEGEPPRVFIERSRIVITDKIFFQTAKSIIKVESYSLLNEIADLILAHEDIRQIRVEGHTDSDGSDTYNLDLSQARAEAVVDYLVGRGVERTRLDPAGFGERRPIDDNDNDAGKQKNRRVEFLIVDRD